MDDLLKQRIWNILDSIEDKLGKMAHEVPELAEDLELYQNGKIKPLYYFNKLTKVFDELNR